MLKYLLKNGYKIIISAIPPSTSEKPKVQPTFQSTVVNTIGYK